MPRCTHSHGVVSPLSLSASQNSDVCDRTGEKLSLKGLSHEIDFKNFDKNLQNLAYLRDAAGF